MARVIELTIDGVEKSSSAVGGDGAVMGLLSRARDARKISKSEHDGAIHLLGPAAPMGSSSKLFPELTRGWFSLPVMLASQR